MGIGAGSGCEWNKTTAGVLHGGSRLSCSVQGKNHTKIWHQTGLIRPLVLRKDQLSGQGEMVKAMDEAEEKKDATNPSEKLRRNALETVQRALQH